MAAGRQPDRVARALAKLAVLAAVLTAPASSAIGAPERAPAVADWRRVATLADRVRLRGWRDAWMEALARARGKPADAAALAGDPALFDPDRALSGAVPPLGNYRCRVTKLGAKGTAMGDFTRYPEAICAIGPKGAAVRFDLLAGPQRPVGTLYPDRDTRAVFIGTLVIGDERGAMTYGRDAARDLVGYIERVGEKRWRLVLPYPRFESVLDVIEVVR